MTNNHNRRNIGVDLLRLLSMYMIVVLHVLGQGGVMVRITSRPATYYVVWALETAAFCAVNCYGLISGYVGVTGRFRPIRLLSLWLSVEFYTVGITAVLGIWHPDWITREVILQSVFPVMWKAYWYFSAYAALFCLTPFLNRMVLSLTVRERRILIRVLFIVFCLATVIPKAFGVDFLSLSSGYTFVWLLVLYVYGACLRLAKLPRRKAGVWISLYVSMTALSWGSKYLIESITLKAYGEARYGRVLITYTAPTIMLCAVSLLLLFAGMRLKSAAVRLLIRICSPLSFGVYIIHVHPLIWAHILKDAFRSWANLPPQTVIFPVLAAAGGIFLVCLMIEFLRQRLFALLRINAALDRLEERIEQHFDRSQQAQE